ncbi:MAG: C39 family peptidase [Anaerolineaceae bacterium]|nr:C39 family peptidase [Anaerolineaceae bacterium]
MPESINTKQAATQATAEATPTLVVTEIKSSPFPNEHYIWDIRGHRQYFPLGCEASVAVDWAEYFGISINEFEFQHKLPLSDNPDLGYVGGIEGPWGQVPPYSYGVHAGPIADLLVDYGLNAIGLKDFTIDELKVQVAQDKPVIAWVIGNCVGGVPYEYTDSKGNTSIVAAYEHVVIVTGYSDETIRYMNNGKFYDTPTEVFLNSWSVLGKMVVISGD